VAITYPKISAQKVGIFSFYQHFIEKTAAKIADVQNLV